jgi:hypothetical protein
MTLINFKMYSQDIIDRFWKKVEKTDTCWNWTAYKQNGYGYFQVNTKKLITAHRFSFQLKHNRLIKDKLCILHSCDNPKCVNPDHLSEGTQPDNIKDMCNKGRNKCGSQKGMTNPMSKLTELQVLEIRAKYAKGGTSHLKLGKEYNVNQATIGFIINRKLWSHI